MMHIIPQTRDEKITMYMKLTKRELAEMLSNANEALTARNRPVDAVSPHHIESTTIPPATIWSQRNFARM